LRTRLAGSREASCSSRPARWPRRPRRRHGCRRAIRSPVISRRWCSGVPSRLACCRMVDSGGGIDIQVQPLTGTGGRAHPRVRGQPGYRAEGRIDQPPNRGRRGGGAEDAFPITAPLCPTPAMQSAPPATAGPDPRTPDPARRSMAPVGIRHHRSDLRRQPGQLRHLAQHPHPAVRHTMPVRRHFDPGNRCATLIPAKCLFASITEAYRSPINAVQDRHFRLSTPDFGNFVRCPTAARTRRRPPPPPRR